MNKVLSLKMLQSKLTYQLNSIFLVLFVFFSTNIKAGESSTWKAPSDSFYFQSVKNLSRDLLFKQFTSDSLMLKWTVSELVKIENGNTYINKFNLDTSYCFFNRKIINFNEDKIPEFELRFLKDLSEYRKQSMVFGVIWNIMDVFHLKKPKNWDEVFNKYSIQLETKEIPDYKFENLIKKMLDKLNDFHTFIFSFDHFKYSLPCEFFISDDRRVFIDRYKKWHGAEVLEINETPVNVLLDSMGSEQFYSNLLYKSRQFLKKVNLKKSKLKIVLNSDTIQKTFNCYSKSRDKDFKRKINIDGFKYADINFVRAKKLRRLFTKNENLIIDFRDAYPNEKTDIWEPLRETLVKDSLYKLPFIISDTNCITNKVIDHSDDFIAEGTIKYSGQIIALCNEGTFSQSEYYVHWLKMFHPSTLTIGCETANANGQMSFINTPFGLISYTGAYFPLPKIDIEIPRSIDNGIDKLFTHKLVSILIENGILK